MPLIMGILAQAAAAPGPTPGAGAYDLLETEILTGTQSSVTFSSLNSTYGSTYQHLQIRMTGQSSNTAAGGAVGIAMQMNSDTGANYAFHILFGNGSSVSSTASSSRNDTIAGLVPRNATAFSGSVCDILDPFETTKYTTTRTLTGLTSSGYRIDLQSGLWMNTAALTDITLKLQDSSNFVTGSRFSLYGLKKAA